jgi:hypothetical protein
VRERVRKQQEERVREEGGEERGERGKHKLGATHLAKILQALQ